MVILDVCFVLCGLALAGPVQAASWKGPHKYFQVLVEAVTQDQVVSHADAMRLHGMVAPIIRATNVTCNGAVSLLPAKSQQ